MLCRTSRLFMPLQQAFAERDIPVEIVGLAGLLRLPEVVEVLAYARAANDPLASVALARILMGPRYRVGFKDLALVAGWAKAKNYAWREEGGDDEETPFLLAEALEHLDEVEGLSDEGRTRLEAFAARARRAPRGSAPPRRRVPGRGHPAHRASSTSSTPTSIAPSATQRAATSRRSSTRCTRFEPIEGELTLRAFLDYVDAVERAREGGMGDPSSPPTRTPSRS